MRNLLQGIALGVLLATGILAFVHYSSPSEVVLKEKEYTLDSAVSFLESQNYEVVKKDTKQPSITEENHTEVDEDIENVEKDTDSPVEENINDYQLTIKSGMSSIDVSELLYENGIVDDADAFNDYLGEHGYQKVIRIGTYKLNEQMSYEQIAITITN